jgi:hypothetical protein
MDRSSMTQNSNHTLRPAIVAISAIDDAENDPTIATIATIASRFVKIQKFTDAEIEFEERAAILEFDGGFSRAQAERLAHHEPQSFTKTENAD